jgi:DNA-binding NarL/FixJ family response regulator
LEQSDFPKALAEGIRSLHLFQQLDFPFFTMNTNTCCGVLCGNLNLYNEAIEYLNQSHAIAMQMGDKRAAIIVAANLNYLRVNVLPPEDCISLNEAFLISIKDAYDNGPSTAEVGTCHQLAYLYIKTGQLKLAENFADRGYAVLGQLIHLPPHHFLYTNFFCVKADIAAANGDEENMLKNTDEGIARGKLINKNSPEIDMLFILFKFYLHRNDLSAAKKYLDKATLLIPASDRDIHYSLLNESRGLYYHTIGDIAQEMEYVKLVHEYKVKALQKVLASKTEYITTIYDLEMVKKEAEIQKKELDYKTQELNLTTHYLQQRNELLTDLKESITSLQKQRSSSDSIVKTISEKIKQAHAREEVDKVRFKEKFDEAQRGFIAELHSRYSSLSATECRISALLRSGFNSKEIANLLSSSVRTIENHRATIRRKMNLGREDNLNMMLAEIR